MNVVCGQCGTGYEFDDALVSERGTTVRCTQCGFQFRVRPSTTHGSGPERWIVRKVTGEEYIFRSLSELQRAIGQRRVVIEDSLSRDGTTFRPMRELSELDCFFEPSEHSEDTAHYPAPRSGGATWGEPSVTPTAQMIAPAHVTARKVTPPGGFVSSAHEAIATASHPPPASGNSGRVSRAHETPPVALPRVAVASVRVPQATSRALPPVRETDRATPVAPEGLPRRRRGQRHGEWEEAFAAPLTEATAGEHVPLLVEAPGRPDSGGYSPPANGAVPAGFLSKEPSTNHTRSPITIPPPEKSMGLRWIAGLVLLGGMGLIAGTVGRDYLEQFRAQGVQIPTEQNARVEQYLAEGDELYRAGDLEEARAQYDKASVLAEGNVEVALRLLRIEATRADVEWLRLQLLAADAQGTRETTEARFAERTAKLSQRVREYEQAAGEQPSAEGVGALVDALRIQNQTSKARALVEQSTGLGADASAAYVSAMLDVAEPTPVWTSVIARLKQAVSGERGLGRAQAALVYALARSGDTSSARQQLDVLSGFRRSHPLVDDLRTFIERAQTVESASEVRKGSEAATDETSDPSVQTTDTDGDKPRGRIGGVIGEVSSNDPMREAAEARAAGELARAGRLYTQALSKEPGNVAAMTGLGDVARSQGNTDIALSHYGAALRQNPNYAPAVLACADLKWATGDRSGAVELYRRLSAGGPERVARRIAEFEKGNAPLPEQSAPPAAAHGVGSADVTPSGPAPQATPEVEFGATPNPSMGHAP